VPHEPAQASSRGAVPAAAPAAAQTTAFLGLKFGDSEEQKLVEKIGYCSVGLLAMSLILLIVHALLVGEAAHGMEHILIAITLPILGYIAVANDNHGFVWIFHLGTVSFAVIHAMKVWILFIEVEEFEKAGVVPMEEKFRIGGIFFWWLVLTAPLFALQIYSAQLSHEYYFRLRVRKLQVQPGERLATVYEVEGGEE